MRDLNHNLSINTFSLNDSAIVRALQGNSDYSIYLDHSHTMVSEIFLKKDSLLYIKRLDRTNFKPFLDSDFYEICNLFGTEIDTIKNNEIHLITDLAVPDSDNQWQVFYYYKIKNNRIDSLYFKNAEYVGL